MLCECTLLYVTDTLFCDRLDFSNVRVPETKGRRKLRRHVGLLPAVPTWGARGIHPPLSWELVVGAEAGPEVLFPAYDSPGKTLGTFSISRALLPPNGVTAPASLG